MADLSLIKGLRLGGEIFEKVAVIGGSDILKTCKIAGYIKTIILFTKPAYGSVIWTCYKMS
jgi:hypothetical protein